MILNFAKLLIVLAFNRKCCAIIDIMFLYQSNLLMNNKFSADNRHHWLAVTAMKLNSAWNSSDIRVHVLGNVHGSHVMNDSMFSGFHFIDLSIPLLHIETKKFQALYRHQSVNQKYYEFWCFNRWIILSKYIESRKDIKIDTVLVMNNDVIVFEDVKRLLEKSMRLANSVLTLIGSLTIHSIA